MKTTYEADDAHFSAPAYSVKAYGGVAWWAMGWETAADEDTEWTGVEERTGKVVCRMVGDDRNFVFSEDDLTPLRRAEFCGGCGQIGCGCDTGGE